MVEVHRCRFVDYTPHSITNLKFSHSSTKKFAPNDLRLAVSRNNGDVEIWNPKSRWIHETTLFGGKERTIEGLVWAVQENESPRLFSIGGSTILTEWNLQTGLPLKNFDCNAAVVWSIAINESNDKVALGCDDGTVVVVDISGGAGSIEHFAFLQRQDSRVLSLTFQNDDHIIAGCADGRIRVWNFNLTESSRYNLIATMRVDKSKTDATLVWSVIYLPNLKQIVTGDSTGSVKFWDFKNFTLLQTYKVHEADVLTLTSDFSNESVFSAGVDRKIFKFQYIEKQSSKTSRWINNSNRLFHSNDIRSMTSYESKNFNFLVSGGVEKTIAISSIKSFTDGQYRKLSIIPQQEHVIINKLQKLIILWQDQTVKIWKLKKRKIELQSHTEETSDNEDYEFKNFKDSYELVSKLTLSDEENISTAAVSQDGSILAIGRLTNTKLFKLQERSNSNKLRVSKINNEKINAHGSRYLEFYGNESLILATPENEIYKFKLEDESSDEDEVIEYELADLPRSKCKIPYIENIKHIKILHSKLIVSRISGAIDIIDLDNNLRLESTPFLRLSTYINRLEISRRETLILVTNENKIYEFNLKEFSNNANATTSSSHLTQWSKINSEFLPREFLHLQEVPLGLFFDQFNDHKIWVYGSDWLAFFDLSLNIPISNQKKDKKRNRQGNQIGIIDNDITGEDAEESDEEQDDFDIIDNTRLSQRLDFLKNESKTEGTPFGITHNYKPILYANTVTSDDSKEELVIIERPKSALTQPPAFKLNKIVV